MMGRDNKGWPGAAESTEWPEGGRRQPGWTEAHGQGQRSELGGTEGKGRPRVPGGYLRKASSGVGPRLGWGAGPSEETSTRRLPVPEGAEAAAGGGAARSPRRSAEGEGVDCRK